MQSNKDLVCSFISLTMNAVHFLQMHIILPASKLRLYKADYIKLPGQDDGHKEDLID
jgi:hypothetical protein